MDVIVCSCLLLYAAYRREVTLMHSFLLALSLLLAQAPAAAQTPEVTVPTWPNPTCPVMGKPISARLYTDTKYGRIYICCKTCVKDIQDDVETNYKASYPTTVKVENSVCPVTGSALPKLTEGQKPVLVVLQGREFRVADAKAATLASEDAQATLAKLSDPKLIDVANATCPVSGGAVAKNIFVVHDGRIVRLSSIKVIEDYKKDAAKYLAKALELRAKQDAQPQPKKAAQ